MKKTINFSKYQSSGNDFIILNGFRERYELFMEQIKFLCERKFGVGADGLIIVKPAPSSNFKIDYYNSDGKIASMCGNGGLCAASFAFANNIVNTKTFNFSAADGIHKAKISRKEGMYLAEISMSDVSNVYKIEENMYFLNTGSPHIIIFVDDVINYDVVSNGRIIRNNKNLFPEGTNVNFVERKENYLLIRTYERGVEDETLSCGTGAVASAIVEGYLFSQETKLLREIRTKGGILKASCEKQNNNFTNIYLEGSPIEVFSGKINP